MGKKLSKHTRTERDAKFAEGKVWCNECCRYLHVNQFSPMRGDNSNYGYVYKCYHCRRQVARASGYVEFQAKKARNRFRSNKLHFVEMFGGECLRCGFSDSFWALEFHHVFPSEKSFTPSQVISLNNRDKALEELDKCIMICSNCHKTYKKTWDAKFKKAEYGYIILRESRVNIHAVASPSTRVTAQPKLFE